MQNKDHFMRNLFVLVVLSVLAGCSGQVAVREESGKVTGKLSSKDGQPIKSVSLTFQPLTSGLPATFQVSENGDFEGEMHSGKYTYYVGKSSSKNSDLSLKNIDAKFLDSSMDRTINVVHGKELLVVLQ